MLRAQTALNSLKIIDQTYYITAMLSPKLKPGDSELSNIQLDGLIHDTYNYIVHD